MRAMGMVSVKGYRTFWGAFVAGEAKVDRAGVGEAANNLSC